MTYGNPFVNTACFLLILAAVVLFPFYAMWIGIGWLMDRRDKWR